jgi:hypothetical protein
MDQKSSNTIKSNSKLIKVSSTNNKCNRDEIKNDNINIINNVQTEFKFNFKIIPD